MNGHDYKYCLYFKDSSKEPLTIEAIDLRLFDYIKARSRQPESIKDNPNALIYIFNAINKDNKSLLKAIVDRKKEFSPRFKYTEDDFSHVVMVAESKNAVHYGFTERRYCTKSGDKYQKIIPIIYNSDFSNLRTKLSGANIEVGNLREFFNPSKLLDKIIDFICNEENKDNAIYSFLKERIFKIVEEKYDYENDLLKNKYLLSYCDYSFYDKQNLKTLLSSDIINDKFGKGSTLYFNLLSLYVLYERFQAICDDRKVEFRDEVLTYIGYELITESYKSNVSYKSISDIRYDFMIQEQQRQIAADEAKVSDIINMYNTIHNTDITYEDYMDNLHNGMYDSLTDYINYSLGVDKPRTRK